MQTNQPATKKIIITPVASIDFNGERVRKSKEIAKEKKKELAQLYKLDPAKLNIRISI